MPRSYRLAAFIVSLCLAATVGCSPAKDGNPEKPAKNIGAVDKLLKTNNLKQIGVAYQTFLEESKGKPPADKGDLTSHLRDVKSAVEMLDKGDIVFYYGVTRMQMPEGSSATILAHEAAADDKGNRLVLLGDGAVKEMTKDEFDKAPKAKQ
jgi:hypothetical protein